MGERETVPLPTVHPIHPTLHERHLSASAVPSSSKFSGWGLSSCCTCQLLEKASDCEPLPNTSPPQNPTPKPELLRDGAHENACLCMPRYKGPFRRSVGGVGSPNLPYPTCVQVSACKYFAPPTGSFPARLAGFSATSFVLEGRSPVFLEDVPSSRAQVPWT